ncbi:hypothetical protein ACTVCO_08485 [Sanguibacter sp. A247]|uniref:hypothetical protein n=1 Tax=unclassified Sanguibacter TaxID=2645534 RepID=UPI003FD76682
MPASLKGAGTDPTPTDDQGAEATTVYTIDPSELLVHYIQLSKADTAVLNHGMDVLSLHEQIAEIEAFILREDPQMYISFLFAAGIYVGKVAHPTGGYSEYCSVCHKSDPEWFFRS